jgi:hypothetical protein
MSNALVPWVDSPDPFGNAAGLDTVALDVYGRIAHRFGATLTVGHLPADIQAEQPSRREAAERHYGERASHLKPREPFAVFTISWDGGTFSGEHADGKGNTSGYRGHYWLDRIGPRTIVIDLRSVPEDRIVSFAVRGPMLDVRLPDGMISTFRTADIGPMRDVAEAYLAPYGGVAATGADLS